MRIIRHLARVPTSGVLVYFVTRSNALNRKSVISRACIQAMLELALEKAIIVQCTIYKPTHVEQVTLRRSPEGNILADRRHF